MNISTYLVLIPCPCTACAALFVPGYQSYIGSCVHHTANHTFVSRNLNSLAFNFAAGEGSAVIGRGLVRYNAESAQYCSNSATKSLQANTALLNQLIASNQTLSVRLQCCVVYRSDVQVTSVRRYCTV
jgi:predicted MFS family arabinose efflux permease